MENHNDKARQFQKGCEEWEKSSIYLMEVNCHRYDFLYMSWNSLT